MKDKIDDVIINSAINYIFEHIDEEISVDDVASYCGYSRYYLMRLFKENTDEALYEFIKRIRLERCAWKLKVEKDLSVTEIGTQYGYSSSNFATAFKKHLNISPSSFRKESEDFVNKSSFSYGMSISEIEDLSTKISIEYLDDMFVVYERKKGNYNNLAKDWQKFIDKYLYLVDDNTLYIECTMDDPSITDENSCMYELAQTIHPSHPELKDTNILTNTYKGGKYAIYHFKGYPQFMYMIYQEVFCHWLKKSGNKLDDRAIIDIYRFVRNDGYMEIDICFPIM